MQTPYSSEDGESDVTSDGGYTAWTIDEFRPLLQLAIKHRKSTQCIAWKDVMDHVSGWNVVVCQNQYHNILRRYRDYISGNHVIDRFKAIVVELEALLQECNRLDDKFREYRNPWTLLKDLEMIELYHQGKPWDQIAGILGMKNKEQCTTRVYGLIRRQRKIDKGQMVLADQDQPLVTGQLPSGRTVALGQLEFTDMPIKEQRITKFTKTWTQADDDKLQDLMAQQAKFKYSDFKEHFPGVGYEQLRKAFQRVSSRRDDRAKPWTKEEEVALMHLVEKHGRRWKKIAEKLPTDRSPQQCYDLYRLRSNGMQRKKNTWTEEEYLRLEILVELFMQEKLLPIPGRRNTRRGMRTCQSSPTLIPDDLASVDELKQLLDNLQGQRSHKESPAEPDSQQNKRIKWKWVAPYMSSKTLAQCQIKWHFLQSIKQRSKIPIYVGPWTREEDLELYKLYTRAPNKWKWISENLPKFRDYQPIIKRYNKYIKYYVDLLKNQKEAGWDPTDDQFEEVHKLCEIRSWRHRLLKGYRIQDGYKAPDDLNLEGDSYCFDN
ncbi:hypothetical protein BX070DRAFT_226146 [Coemansia spiralis]|nr:hypothetical protein BX070DRAFT_226146 [Coemansia spiralis]